MFNYLTKLLIINPLSFFAPFIDFSIIFWSFRRFLLLWVFEVFRLLFLVPVFLTFQPVPVFVSREKQMPQTTLYKTREVLHVIDISSRVRRNRLTVENVN